MRKFKIDKDYKDIGCDIYKKNYITLKPGITILVGCNGMGKTTLIQQLKHKLENNNIPVISFDNLHDGGSRAREKAGFYGDVDFLATSIQSSEGENINMNLGRFASQIGRFVRENRDKTELWIFLDAVDSGLSVDNIVDLKELLFKTILNDVSDSDVYIIASANEYELARDENCFDVYTGNYITFKNYEEYRSFIIKTRMIKDKRLYKDEFVDGDIKENE